MTDLNLRDLLHPPAGAERSWYQQRGRTFERVLIKLLSREDLEPRASMRPDGEEIDGSFVMGDRYFLMEAKWHSAPIPASSLYAFKGKVDGKLVGTIGIFFSMSDFSTDAVDALLAGKELNLILVGHSDLLLIEDGKITMRDAIRAKLRYAANYGQPFFPLETHLAEHAKASQETDVQRPQQDWTILVESEQDVRTIEELLDRFVTASKVSVIPAGGQLSIAALAQHIKRTGTTSVAAVVTPIADLELQQEQLQELANTGADVVALHHSLEDWLGCYVPVDYYNSTIMLSDFNGKMARRFARNAELEKLLAANPSFSELMDKLDAHPKGPSK